MSTFMIRKAQKIIDRQTDKVSYRGGVCMSIYLFLTGEGELFALFLDFLAGALSSSSSVELKYKQG